MIQSPALTYVQSKGWQYKASGDDKIELERCIYCGKGGYGHFYLVISDGNRDGLFCCHKCGATGNLTSLREKMGDKIAGVTPISQSYEKMEPLPDIEATHQALLENEEALDYLTNTRGFSRAIIIQQKIGYTPKRHFGECGDVPAIIYPYLVQGNTVFAHFRSLPPSPKAFSSPKGWDAPLYNSEVIREGIKDFIMVEGEANVIAALDHGIIDIVGVPGANFRKAMWLNELDRLELERIYICYDKDKVGQRAAQTLASRIGIQKCWKITLPDFKVPTEGAERPGKDLNEWFLFGGGDKEAFDKLKQEAVLFDVTGVVNTKDGLDELEEMLNGRDSLKPKYDTPWMPLNRLVGFEDGDVIDICAPEKVGKTTFGMNVMEYEVDTQDEDGIIICLEMGTVRLVRKWVSHVTGTNDSIPKSLEEAKGRLVCMKDAVKTARNRASERKGTLYFCYPQIKEIDDAYKLIIDCIRRYGVKWVMFDNLQLLCDKTLKNQGHRTIHLSTISKNLASIAKDYGIKIIRVLQPHRIRDGAIITTNDVDGASQIAKDCDCMLTLHRNPIGEMTQSQFEAIGFAEQEQAFDSKMLVSVGLSRYSSGGYVTLFFDGATSSVWEFDAAQKAQLETLKPKDGYVIPTEVLMKSQIQTPIQNDIQP